jgi:geranylgeranyl diphosphate synthase type I
MQSTLQDTGALDEVEGMIEDYANTAMTALEKARITEGAKSELRRLADAVTRRNS